MQRRFYGSLLSILLAWIAPAVYGNPLFEAADPHAIRAGDSYWIHATSPAVGPAFTAWRSADLKRWEQSAPVLHLDQIPWLVAMNRPRLLAWAPCIIGRDGKFFFYYSVGPQSKEFPSIIGVASGDSPAGPFKDSGKPLLIGGDGFEAIDPMVFRDPASGIHYFYAGGSAGARLRVFELDDSMTSFRREIPVETPPNFTEGAFVHQHAGTYYLSYSHGPFNTPEYSVHYATSPHPTGPWTYQGCILSSDATHQGPGHHSFLEGPEGPLIVYHRWETAEKRGPLKGRRRIAIERFGYGEKGLIPPIRQTDSE